MFDQTLPRLSDLEVTLLGPGYGESIVLHYGGSWIVIDSCRHPTKLPAAEVYLSAIGVGLDQVNIVACTHWHDDHCAGLSDLYSRSPNAELIVSQALKTTDFVKLGAAYRTEKQDNVSSGVDEVYQAFHISKTRGKVPKFARSDQVLWRSADDEAELHALSPCDKMITESLLALSSLLPVSYADKRPIVAKDNHVSIAMLFKAGHHSVLLGSDLEETGRNAQGWSAIINSNLRPKHQSSLYKVAHHGSETGEHPGIWKSLLQSGPISIITPFSKLRDPLPRDADRERLKRNSSVAILTADAKAKRIERRGALRKLTAPHNLQLKFPTFGAVRCRIDANDIDAKWQIARHESTVDL